MDYKMVIDPNKWEPIADAKLESNTPYWCKMTDGRIVMAAPYSNRYSSGMGVCSVDDTGLHIKTNSFYILRGSLIQPVVLK